MFTEDFKPPVVAEVLYRFPVIVDPEGGVIVELLRGESITLYSRVVTDRTFYTALADGVIVIVPSDAVHLVVDHPEED